MSKFVMTYSAGKESTQKEIGNVWILIKWFPLAYTGGGKSHQRQVLCLSVSSNTALVFLGCISCSIACESGA